MQINELAEKGTEAVKSLRRHKLLNGNFFMINASGLPRGQCYIEYPDGRIVLVMLSSSRNEFDEIQQLSAAESNSLRIRYQLY